MADYKLWGFGESGNAYKAALMLELCGLTWTPIFVDFFNGETRSDAYRRDVNEMGEVPVLDDGNAKLTQSGVILEYLAGVSGKFGWQNEDERREVWRWILFDNHKFTANIATLRFLVNFTKNPNSEVVEFLKARVNGAMKILDRHLATREWIACARPTIADISMAGYLYYGSELPFQIGPHVQAWSGRVSALSGWKHPYDLMKRGFTD